MATYTTNYGLKKPELTDHYSVSDMNGNSDIIDSAIKGLESKIPSGIVIGTYIGNGAVERRIDIDGDVDAVIVTCPGNPDTVSSSMYYQSYLVLNGGMATSDAPVKIDASPTASGISAGYSAYSLTALEVNEGGFTVGNSSVRTSDSESYYTYSCNGVIYRGSCLLSAQLNVTGRTYGYIVILKKQN